jgi:hypothetical protein
MTKRAVPPPRRARRRPVSANGAAVAAHAVVVGRKSVWTFADVRSLDGPEPDRLAAVLDDGRLCVSAAPWYSGSITRALNDIADQGQPIASRSYRGALLVETRLVLFSEAVGEPPYDLAAVEAAVRAAVANSGQR